MSLATTLLSHSWGEEQRFKFHATFNAWMTTCPEEDYLRLMHLREQVAPGQVCSIVTLLRSCFADPALSAGLPSEFGSTNARTEFAAGIFCRAIWRSIGRASLASSSSRRWTRSTS